MTGIRKLIEVALPLDEINAACKADKDRKTGTIRNLHKWFAPMPLPAWRALIFAALIDDPEDDEKRAYLLDVIKRLVANGADLPDRTRSMRPNGFSRISFLKVCRQSSTHSVVVGAPSWKRSALVCPHLDRT